MGLRPMMPRSGQPMSSATISTMCGRFGSAAKATVYVAMAARTKQVAGSEQECVKWRRFIPARLAAELLKHNLLPFVQLFLQAEPALFGIGKLGGESGNLVVQAKRFGRVGGDKQLAIHLSLLGVEIGNGTL